MNIMYKWNDEELFLAPSWYIFKMIL